MDTEMHPFDRWWAIAQSYDASPIGPSAARMEASDGAGLRRFGFTYPTFISAVHHIAHEASQEPACVWEDFLNTIPFTFRSLARAFFWQRLFAQDMPGGVAISIVDWVFTDGEEAIRAIQRGLGFQLCDVDGAMNPSTLAQILALGPSLIHTTWQWRVAYYDTLAFRPRWPGLYRRALEVRDISLRTTPPPLSDTRHQTLLPARVFQ